MIRKQNKNHYELKDNNKIIEQNRIHSHKTIYIYIVHGFIFIYTKHSQWCIHIDI